MRDFETCHGGLELHNTSGIAISHGYGLLIVLIAERFHNLNFTFKSSFKSILIS